MRTRFINGNNEPDEGCRLHWSEKVMYYLMVGFAVWNNNANLPFSKFKVHFDDFCC